jgi:hypothetical protein
LRVLDNILGLMKTHQAGMRPLPRALGARSQRP